MPKSHTLIRLDLIPPHSICIDVYSRNEPIDPLHVCGNAAKLEDKTKEICASVKQSYCSVLQIGCILTDVKGVYSLEMSRSLTWNWTTLFRNIKRVTQSFFGWVGIFHIFPNPLWMRRFLQVKVWGMFWGCKVLLASRCKFRTFVQLAFRLATHLRRLATSCVDFGWAQIWTQVDASFLPFGYPVQVDTSLLRVICNCYKNALTNDMHEMYGFLRAASWLVDPFGHSLQVCTQVLVLQTCIDLHRLVSLFGQVLRAPWRNILFSQILWTCIECTQNTFLRECANLLEFKTIYLHACAMFSI